MIITCEECRASFKLSDTLIKPSGSKVRCSKCKHVFVVFKEPIEPEFAMSIPETESEPEAPRSKAPLSLERSDFGLEDIEKAVESTFPGADLSIPENFFTVSETAAGPETRKTSDLKPQEDEIDFSDLEKMLDIETGSEGEARKGSEDGTENDIDYRIDGFKIEEDFDDPVAVSGKAKSADPAKEEIIDLSEIEKLLDFGQSEKKEETEDSIHDLNLELDFGEGYKPEEMKTDESDLSGPEELDLSDLEKMLQPEEEAEPAADEGMAFLREDSPRTSARFESIFEEKGKPAEDSKAKDLQIEYELETDLFADASKKAVPEDARVAPEDPKIEHLGIGAVPPGNDLEEESLAEAEELSVIEKPREKERKRRIGAPVLVMLTLVLLTGAGLGAFYVLDNQDIRIPYISDFLNPKVPDAGNLKMGTYDITSHFVENGSTGRLFLISGNVKNEYPEPRGMIRITGKLFTGGKNEAKSETVFCGNVLSDTELATLDSEAIKRKLSNQFGHNRSNARVEPGRMIPFMIVFSNLPDNLEEFTIEVVGSDPVK
jgi:pilus assembly protein FimV